MNIELSLEQTSEIIKDTLYGDIKEFEKMILKNYGYHHGVVGIHAPLYSWEYDTEDKKLNKMLKSFIRVYNYHSVDEYEVDLVV